jgi:AcrR family transcriptional regulator
VPAKRRNGPAPGKVVLQAGNGELSRRVTILDAAAKVFSANGFSNATVRQIGDEAGMLSGSLYYHFESKDSMLEEILVRALDDLTHRYGSVAERIDDPIECLRSLVVEAVESIVRNPHSSTILQNDFAYIRQSEKLAWVNDKYLEVRQIWLEVLQRGVDRGVLKSDIDVELAYLTLYGALLSTIRWYDEMSRYSLTDLASRQADMFLAGLAAP